MTQYEKRALEAFKKKYPELTVTLFIDYDQEHFVVEAVKDFNAVDYSDPFYGIDKRSLQVSCFSPAYDADRFLNAIKYKTIFRMNEGER